MGDLPQWLVSPRQASRECLWNGRRLSHRRNSGPASISCEHSEATKETIGEATMLQATSLPIAYCLERAAECETKAERAKNAGIKPTTQRKTRNWLSLARQQEYVERFEQFLKTRPKLRQLRTQVRSRPAEPRHRSLASSPASRSATFAAVLKGMAVVHHEGRAQSPATGRSPPYAGLQAFGRVSCQPVHWMAR
jgi:hypothetical protein